MSAFVDKISELARGPDHTLELLSFHYSVLDILRVQPIVRNLIGKQLPEQGTESKHINLVAIRLLLEQFWGHVGGGSRELHGSCVEVCIKTGKSEIAYFDIELVIAQDI